MEGQDACDCGLRANVVFMNGDGQVYSCTGCMRKNYESLSLGGKEPVFMDHLLDSKGFMEVRPMPAAGWKGFPKASRKYSLTG